MIHQLNVRLPAVAYSDTHAWKRAASVHLGVQEQRIEHIRLLRRSLDARQKKIYVNLRLEVFIDEPFIEKRQYETAYRAVLSAKSVIIIGAGPAGLFAALRLLEAGIKPIILERGKDVRERRRDLAAINKLHRVNPNSNYCFGEGGAGTYSDGKLYTRSDKRGNIMDVLLRFVEFGADTSILVDAHPHIGTNKLPKIIQSMRDKILTLGGEIHFNTCVTELVLHSGKLQGIIAEAVDHSGNFTGITTQYSAEAYILATGHSSRDIFRLLHKHQIAIEPKPFAVGVRVEHPQSLIDSIQYHCNTDKEMEDVRQYLPAASYSLVTQSFDRGVYSFCMCPGGIIAPCATQPYQVVTNGWSPSKRNNPYANSGIVVSVEPDDLRDYQSHGVFAGIALQENLEYTAWRSGGQSQAAPAQRLTDFVLGQFSATLPACSYQPGITSNMLSELLPLNIGKRLQQGFIDFGRKMHGYLTSDAVVVGFETRTSSPVRIPRNEKMQHIDILNLYPCAEGAGYAGGIVSAAIDGRKAAEVIIQLLV
ncbi:MAG: FAD-dependent protein [Bacteroidota bacterium]